MQVFTEFIRTDLSEEQILPVLRQLLPVLLAILGAAEVRLVHLSGSIYILIYRASNILL
jgi:hypothetical protein